MAKLAIGAREGVLKVRTCSTCTCVHVVTIQEEKLNRSVAHCTD